MNLPLTKRDAPWFEDFVPGHVYSMPGTTLDERDIIEFATRWDPYPFHTDPEAAKQHEFGGLFSSGFQTLCLVFRQFADAGVLANCAYAGGGLDRLRWLRPVRPGDTIRSTAEVLELKPSPSRSNIGRVVMRHTAINQHDETVMTVLCTHVVKRRRAAG
ncbi:MAG TPA: MaoC family dehydratase [Alphaproteobacteria bacterium]|jgi:acyl dehydratase|nr:MaoC family dehydratase [Alphaproteobacteria bacterium]